MNFVILVLFNKNYLKNTEIVHKQEQLHLEVAKYKKTFEIIIPTQLGVH